MEKGERREEGESNESQKDGPRGETEAENRSAGTDADQADEEEVGRKEVDLRGLDARGNQPVHVENEGSRRLWRWVAQLHISLFKNSKLRILHI